MVSVDDALRLVLSHCESLPVIEVPLGEALNLVTAQDITTPTPFPPFRASTMDGYAVVSSDGTGVFHVLTDVTAGDGEVRLVQKGQVVYITTGAPVPDGCDAVVMVEETEAVANDPDKVRILVAAQSGQNIRPIGCDMKAGEVVLPRGTPIRASEIGILAAVGITMVRVYPPPRVAVMSTGDELVDISVAELPSGKIRDSNRPMLLAAVTQAGGKGIDHGMVQDKQHELQARMLKCISDGDIAIFSGGVSMGSLDLVKPLLSSMGTMHFGRLNMKPGKPTTFATVQVDGKTKLVFALPGNPVSAMVTFQLLAEPAIRAVGGHTPNLPKVPVTLAQDTKLDPRPEYHRALLRLENGGLVAYSTGHQISSRLLSLRSAVALIELPSGKGSLPQGTSLSARLIGPLNDLESPTPNIPAPDPKSQAFCRCDRANNNEPVTKRARTEAQEAKPDFEIGVCVLTISDRCSSGQAVDLSGPSCAKYVEEHSPQGAKFIVKHMALVPDDVEAIRAAIRNWTDGEDRPHLVITTGGTGFSPRDVTPEAVKPLFDKEAPGLVFSMISHSLKHTPMAVLSRPVAGTRNQSIILTLPGNPKAGPEILENLLPILPHPLKLLQGDNTSQHRTL